MELAAHRIRRQSWMCRARTAGEAFALRGRLREAQETAVPAVFERAFDAACPDGEVIVLPRLELRLKLASVDDLAAVLPDLLARALREQLAGLLTPASAKAVAHNRSLSSKSVRASFEEALGVYLTTGTLPWELAQTDATALREQLQEIAAADLAAVLARAPEMHAPLLQQIAFFFRLLQLVPEERWGEVIECMLLRLPAALAGEIRRMAVAEGARSELWWRIAASEASPPGPLSHRPPADRERGRKSLEAGTENELVAGARIAREKRSGNKTFGHVSPSPGRWGGDGRGGQGVRSNRAATSATSAPALEPSAGPPSILASSTAEPTAFPLPVRSAGLVLLHPFLPRLFESTDLVRAGEPGLPWATLPRAAALLHWLATGREEVLEFELGFIKILLGRRPEEPLLVSDGLLTAADREEGEALLQAAIGHWRALKSTTPAGLRASFLQRGGLLREKETGWHLQVEPAAFDLLLDHLPWGLGVVKLPWMTQPIFTDWPTP